MSIPTSKLVKKQVKTLKKEGFRIDGGYGKIIVKIRYDDECGNGHNDFSITGTIFRDERDYGGGAIHDDIAEYFPELEHLIKWHLCSSDEPWGYVANTMYHASEKDCNGLLKGESRQLKNGRTNQPCWESCVMVEGEYVGVHVKGIENTLDSDTKPKCSVRGVSYQPWCIIGEGKIADIKAAQNRAIWPDATLEQLNDKKALEARLPTLMNEFKTVVESLGFEY